MVAYNFNPSTEVTETGESLSLKPVNLAYLYSKFQANRSSIERYCLSEKKKVKIVQNAHLNRGISTIIVKVQRGIFTRTSVYLLGVLYHKL